MKILVTGAAGFIGSKAAQLLAERGNEVVGLDNLNDYYDISLKLGRLDALTGIQAEDIQYKHFAQSRKYPNYRFIKLDITDREALNELFRSEKFDRVCHLAAQAGVRYSLESPHSYADSNLSGFLNILEACRHNPVQHLAYASSSSVYGLNTKVPFSEKDHTDHPASLYAATKKANELMAHSYSHLYGIPTTGLRFFTVYGPWGRPDMAPFLFMDAILNDRPIQVFNNGDMLRDFTYVDDIVKGVIKVIDHAPERSENAASPDVSTAPYRVYNIGNSSPVKLMDFISTIEKVSGKEAQKIFKPMQPGDVYQTNADMTSLEKDLGFKPNTDLETGLGHFAKWYREYFNL
ncbi:NAD-dependent epimerase [Bacteroidales bacterium OttesenSCG-928-J19]|nr:NAD-dependent epimerase [Bacteroidales bacterium OttesenSCG-928-J19]